MFGREKRQCYISRLGRVGDSARASAVGLQKANKVTTREASDSLRDFKRLIHDRI